MRDDEVQALVDAERELPFEERTRLAGDDCVIVPLAKLPEGGWAAAVATKRSPWRTNVVNVADLSLPAPPEPPSVDAVLDEWPDPTALVMTINTLLSDGAGHYLGANNLLDAARRRLGARTPEPEPSDDGPDLPEVGRLVDVLDLNGEVVHTSVEVAHVGQSGAFSYEWKGGPRRFHRHLYGQGWSWRYSDDGPPDPHDGKEAVWLPREDVDRWAAWDGRLSIDDCGLLAVAARTTVARRTDSEGES